MSKVHGHRFVNTSYHKHAVVNQTNHRDIQTTLVIITWVKSLISGPYEKDDAVHSPASIAGSYSWSRYVTVLSDTHQTCSLLYI